MVLVLVDWLVYPLLCRALIIRISAFRRLSFFLRSPFSLRYIISLQTLLRVDCLLLLLLSHTLAIHLSLPRTENTRNLYL